MDLRGLALLASMSGRKYLRFQIHGFFILTEIDLGLSVALEHNHPSRHGYKYSEKNNHHIVQW